MMNAQEKCHNGKESARHRVVPVLFALVALSFAGCLGVIALSKEAGTDDGISLEQEQSVSEDIASVPQEETVVRSEPVPEAEPVPQVESAPEPKAAVRRERVAVQDLQTDAPVPSMGMPFGAEDSLKPPPLASSSGAAPPPASSSFSAMPPPLPSATGAAPPPIASAKITPLAPSLPDIGDIASSPYEMLPNAAKGATLIFVFDDAGQNLSALELFLTLPFPFTVAVLPLLPHSSASAEKVRAAGKEVILHQPMQAQNLEIDPGPGAISPDMSAEEIKAITEKNIAEIAPVAGVNNHEGSLITESREAMEAVLDVCRANGIYFLDSRTTSATAVPAAAQVHGMTAFSRDVFLDNTPSKSDMLKELTGGLKIANKTGSAIMIGHIWSPALAELLRELYPVLVRKGYAFSTISRR